MTFLFNLLRYVHRPRFVILEFSHNFENIFFTPILLYFSILFIRMLLLYFLKFSYFSDVIFIFQFFFFFLVSYFLDGILPLEVVFVQIIIIISED